MPVMLGHRGWRRPLSDLTRPNCAAVFFSRGAHNPPPQDIELWRPEYSAERKAALQRLHRRGFAIWARRFNVSYRTGILLLLAGVTVALVHPGAIGVGRSIAIAVAAAGFLGELGWVLATWLLRGSPGTAYKRPARRAARRCPGSLVEAVAAPSAARARLRPACSDRGHPGAAAEGRGARGAAAS